jgi:uncharacterized repeat protein (TIGR03803 family)
MVKSAQNWAWTSSVRRFGPSFVPTLALVLGLISPATQSARAQTFAVLYNFTNTSDGAYPYDQPFVDKSGDILGTSVAGTSGYGAVWKLSSSGKLTVLHSFHSSDGAFPWSRLTPDNHGNMFSTTSAGGAYGAGTVFSISPTEKFAKLHSFGATQHGPISIDGGVVLDPSGNFYGTSYEGGHFGYGTVWKLSVSGSKVLHSFSNGRDGGYPQIGNLHRDIAGNLYGLAEFGGSSDCGTLFEISSHGAFRVLHTFTCGRDGGVPLGTIEEYKGNLYGNAARGGAKGYGTVWQYNTRTHKLTVLHSFLQSDGSIPFGGVTCRPGTNAACTGEFYGTASAGGASGNGTLWKVDSKGKFSTLHSFAQSDGIQPFDSPFVDKLGNVYGTTNLGGSLGYGTVWKLAP